MGTYILYYRNKQLYFFILNVSILLLVLPLANAGAEIQMYQGKLHVSSEGWNHIQKNFDFPCDGAADLKTTPCYGKAAHATGEFSTEGKYNLIKFDVTTQPHCQIKQHLAERVE